MNPHRIAAWQLAAEERGKELDPLIRMAGPALEAGDVNGTALLAALAWKESSFGRDGGHPRIEPAYRPNGALHRAHVPALYALYGDCAAASWSSWQIMFPTAVELGYAGEPWGLWEDRTAVLWVIAYIERAVKRGAATVEQIADAYNSGSHKDRFVPEAYVRGLRSHYDRMVRQLEADAPLGP